jgi:hypothetical protein
VLQFCVGQLLPGVIEYIVRAAESDYAVGDRRLVSLGEVLKAFVSVLSGVGLEHRAYTLLPLILPAINTSTPCRHSSALDPPPRPDPPPLPHLDASPSVPHDRNQSPPRHRQLTLGQLQRSHRRIERGREEGARSEYPSVCRRGGSEGGADEGGSKDQSQDVWLGCNTIRRICSVLGNGINSRRGDWARHSTPTFDSDLCTLAVLLTRRPHPILSSWSVRNISLFNLETRRRT